MPIEKELDFLNPKTFVQVIRQKRDDIIDLSENIAMRGFLSSGQKFIQAPCIDEIFGLCDNNPEKCAFIVTAPIIGIMLYEQGWIVVTDDYESYTITLLEQGLRQ